MVTGQWRPELRDFLLTTAYVALTGPVAGLLWWGQAPKLSKQSMARILAGSGAPFNALIGADSWFLLVAALAGAACATVVVLVRGVGPGLLAGLAIGGAAGAVIADRVGYLAGRGHTVAAMHAVGISTSGTAGNVLDFKVRAVGVMVAWPIAAILVFVLALAVKDRNASLP